MYYEIQSVETLDDGNTRCVVWFWTNRAAYLRARQAPECAEDFISNVQGTGSRVVTNEDGYWKLADGTFIDPESLEPDGTYEFERETFTVDVTARLEANIERYLYRQREGGDTNAARIERGELRGDRTSAQLARREVANRADHIRDTRVRELIRTPREVRQRDVQDRESRR